MGRFDAAATHLDRALGVLDGVAAEAADRLRVRVLITRAWTELEVHGRTGALEMLAEARDRARHLDDAVLVALTHIQEGVVHVRGGDWAASLEALAGAHDEEVLTAPQRCALLINRGMAHLGLAHLEEAETDLARARDLAAENGLVDQEFKARHNLACLAFVAGDLPRALVLMREADRMDAAVARDRARLDHAELLLEAGLVDRARTALAEALEVARASGHRLEEGEISVRLARCDLLADDLEGARRHALAAVAAYRTRQVEELVREAELIRATVDVAEGRDLPSVVTALAARSGRAGARTVGDRAAARLEAEARLLLGDVGGAERRLAALGSAEGHETLAATLHESLVRARLDRARDRDADAGRHVVEGNRLLAAHQFQSSSLDVRAALALHGRRLAAFDVEGALATGDPDRVLTSIERWRAVSHRINPVTASTDPALAALTRELRRLRRIAAEREGHDSPGLAEQVAALEADIAHREWTLTVGDALDAEANHVGAVEARAAAAERGACVIQYFEVGGTLHAVVVDGPDTRVVDLGAAAPVAALVQRLRRDLRARATLSGASPLAATLERAVAGSLDAVHRAVDPGTTRAGRVVLVPSRTLAAVPWSLLHGLRGRPVVVAPSLTRWVRGPTRSATAGDGPTVSAPVTALYGPGLPRAAAEVRDVRRAWGTADDAAGTAAASSEEVRAALRTSAVVHLAAHGLHEGQSPLFSSVRMADGPVFAHEFPRPVVAEHVALSACDVGQFSTRQGDEPLGLAIALLALGARSVLAAVAPVADEVAAEAMVAYHGLLARGSDAASAWAEVVDTRPAAGVFCYYGSDWRAGRTGPGRTGPGRTGPGRRGPDGTV